MKMTIKFNANAVLEILVRLILWGLFLWLNAAVAFHRHIAPEELWMYKYPPPPSSYVSSLNLWILILVFPASVFFLEYVFSGFSEDIATASSALNLAYGLNGFVTSFIKVIVGRPRPDFYYRCFPNGGGNDITKCTGLEAKVMDGRKSFPSGHSSFAFTCMVFMTFYITRKLSLWSSTSGQSWRLCATIIPLLIAVSVAVSRTCDYHHHYGDVICGSLLGTSVAGAVYRLYFPERGSQEKILTEEK